VGANLVTQVLAHWTHVSDRAFRVLVRMAVTALDNPTPKQPANIYRAGRDLLAMSLRSEGSNETRYRAVKRAVAELTEAGAIEHLVTGWAGQNAVYRLTLDPSNAVRRPKPMGGRSDPPKGGPTDPPMGGQNATERGVAQTPPRNQEDQVEERGEEEGVAVSTTSHPPRATASEPSIPDSSPRPKKCTHGLGGGLRTDGQPECALCRREQRAGLPPPEPPDPPPNRPRRCDHTPLPGKDRCRVCAADQDIAPVIDLNSRRTA
jgi:hypothetical protein